jgi:phosphatidylglycerophosphate synthase
MSNDNINYDKMLYQESILVSKEHDSLHDPVSLLFYNISDAISPYLYNIGITPNMITITRTILIVCIFTYYFDNEKYNQAGFIYLLCYFMDCLDGQMARKYDMVTSEGDFLDHLADVIQYVVGIYYINKKINKDDKNNKWIIYLLVILLIFSVIQIGCEERYLETSNINETSCINFVKCTCPESVISDTQLERFMDLSSYIGIGIYHLIVCIIIVKFEI